ncbi:MAG TPA: SPOR domain-containing protein, partial [Xanthobacteraceae bacterium]|nr:SPOR domain-containing protein [Xanthobacteraceae bacterium]
SNSGQADSANGTGARIVTNQEQPVDVQSGNPIPRMIKTIPVVPNGSPDQGVTGQPPASVTQIPVPPPGYAEPVAPPTRPFGAAQAPAPQPSAGPPRVPPARPVQQAGPTAGATAPVVRPKPSPKPTVVAETPSAGGPLSLVPPQEGAAPQAPAPARPVHAAANNAAAAVPTTSSAREAAPLAAGAGYVQVSSQRSEAEAQSAYRELQAKFPQQLGSRHAIIHRADLGDKGVYYRALVGPFATADQATAFCSSLKAAGGNCFTQRN